MSDDFLFVARNRLIVEGEQIVSHSVSAGPQNLASLASARDAEWRLRHSRMNTFSLKNACCSKFENLSEVCHPVSAVWVLSGLSVF